MFEGHYEASNLGRIKSLKKGKETILKLGISVKGYSQCSLYLDRKSYPRRVHRMIAYAFLGIEPNSEVNHIDGNKSNNRLDNLEYCTGSENMLHARENDLMSDRKLVKKDVIEIRWMYKRGVPRIVLSKIYKVCPTNISKVVNRKTWKDVCESLPPEIEICLYECL